MVTVYVPSDSTALAVGAEKVAAAIVNEAAVRKVEIKVVRNGSRGLYWLETLVEVNTASGRVAYGPIQESDVKSLFDADFLNGGAHPLCLGDIEQHPFLKNQDRVLFARMGIIDPVSLEDYCAHEGYAGLKNALSIGGEETVKYLNASGLRGRGGAAFPTGIKWKTVLDAKADQKYIVCNADEGDSGTFSDRMVMENDPFMLIEGMTIAGVAVGATQGYIYLRSEYPHAHVALNTAIQAAYAAGYLGDNILNSGATFHLEVRLGAGAYVCGEETALLESLEGKRGIVRFKPPLPALQGLFGKPTVINNVISLASVPVILAKGYNHFYGFGVDRSRGTMPFQLAGNIKHGGLVEKGFGLTLRQLIEDFGGGTANGRPIRAAQVGGPLGAYVPESQFDTPLDYEAFIKIGAMLGHGGVVVFDDSVDMAKMARYAMEFCAVESCGKCTPCRIGSTRGVEVMDKIIANQERDANLILLKDLCSTMLAGSLCALGGMTPYPVMSALQHFPEDFGATDSINKKETAAA